MILTDRDRILVEDKLRGALESIRKGAHFAALLAVNEAALVLERAAAEDVVAVHAQQRD